MVRRYVAIDRNDHRILPVIANNVWETEKRIREQLDRRECRQFLDHWQDGGKRVKVDVAADLVDC